MATNTGICASRGNCAIFWKLKVEIQKINDLPQAVADFYDYFQRNFVGEVKKRGRGFTRTRPLFDPTIWNCFDRLSSNLPRTTNFCEAWHGSFSAIFKSHSPLYDFTDSIHTEQDFIEANIIKIKTGIAPKRKPKYEILNERIKHIVEKFSKENVLEFVENMALNLSV